MPLSLRIPLLCLAVALALWLVGLVCFFIWIAALPAPENMVRTDAIVVLTGGPDRINSGLDLLEAKKAGRLFISGVNERVTVQELIGLWREDIKTPPCCITLGHRALDTSGNAEEAADWVREGKIRSIWLLTADYHMPRALLEFWTAMPEIDIHPYPVRSALPDGGLPHYLMLVAGEYNKTILTRLRIRTKEKAG